MPRSPIAAAAENGPRQGAALLGTGGGPQSGDAPNLNSSQIGIRRSARIAAANAANANIAPNASTGIHLTTRQRDANRAQKYQQAREHYHARSSYWS